MSRIENPISDHCPPDIRNALVEAAKSRDIDTIDRITDIAALKYPDKFLQRRTPARPEFTPRDRLQRFLPNLV